MKILTHLLLVFRQPSSPPFKLHWDVQPSSNFPSNSSGLSFKNLDNGTSFSLACDEDSAPSAYACSLSSRAITCVNKFNFWTISSAPRVAVDLITFFIYASFSPIMKSCLLHLLLHVTCWIAKLSTVGWALPPLPRSSFGILHPCHLYHLLFAPSSNKTVLVNIVSISKKYKILNSIE